MRWHNFYVFSQDDRAATHTTCLRLSMRHAAAVGVTLQQQEGSLLLLSTVLTPPILLLPLQDDGQQYAARQ